MKKNRIALFTGNMRKPTALLISLVTRCSFVHAAICVDDVWYHASESAGRFDKLDVDDYAWRECVMYEFDGELSDWLRFMIGKKYDWKGIFGWFLHVIGFKRGIRGNPKDYYCFEAAVSALESTGVDAPCSPVSGCDVRDLFIDLGISGHFGYFITLRG